MIDYLILGSAVWRVSRLLIHEHGPACMLDEVRKCVGLETLEDGSYDDPKPGSLADLFTCIYCMSVWVGIVFAGLYLLCPAVALAVALPFSLSAVAVALDRYLE